MNVLPGSTSVSLMMSLIDPTTNGPHVAIQANRTDFEVAYVRPGGTVITGAGVALGAYNSVWSDRGLFEINASTCPGECRVDVADAAFAAGVPEVKIIIQDGDGTVIGKKTVSLGGVEANVVELAGGEYKIADTSGGWATAGTWSDGVVPAAGDNIIIRDGVTVTVAASLDLGQFGTLEVQGDGVLDIASGQTVAAVPKGWVIYANNGTITTNNGTVTYNNGTIITNDGTITTNYTNGTITDNYGTVTNNNDTITANYSTVTYNSGTVVSNASGGNVTYNLGTVTTNASGGLVLHNYGTIGTDNGESDVPVVTLDAVATAVLEKLVADHAAVAGSLAQYLKHLDALLGGVTDVGTVNKVIFKDRTGAAARTVTYGDDDAERTASVVDA